MKRLLLLLLGLIPLPLGFLMNALILSEFLRSGLAYLLIGLACLLLWYLSGAKLHRWAGSRPQAIILANLPALIALLLNLYQVLALGRYWPNRAGAATQFFFLPLLNLSFRLTPMFHTMAPGYILAFALMCGAFSLGAYRDRRGRKG